MEILSTGNELEDAIIAIRNKQALKTAEKLARERELAKVTIFIFIKSNNMVLLTLFQHDECEIDEEIE